MILLEIKDNELLIPEEAETTKTKRQLFDRVQHRAYELFELRGRATGFDVEDWLAAESELLPVRTAKSARKQAAAAGA